MFSEIYIPDALVFFKTRGFRLHLELSVGLRAHIHISWQARRVNFISEAARLRVYLYTARRGLAITLISPYNPT